MKIRVKFTKTGAMRFIGHLDVMRYFQKAMRRADIDIAYSEGFSPHQIMSFAAPLGIGLTSEGEYFDMEVHSLKNSQEALKAFNEVMAEGFQVTEFRRLPEGTKNAMASVAAADYIVRFPQEMQKHLDLPALSQSLQEFWGQDAILVVKQTKKGQKTMDLKPLIYYLKAVDEVHPACFLRVCTGSTDNVKPELVLQAFHEFRISRQESGIPCRLPDVQIHRLELYTREDDGTFVPLGRKGQDIV